MAIAIQFASRLPGLPAAADFRRWLRATLPVRTAGTLTLRVVNTAEGRRLNRRFRRLDYATNVLTFAYDTRPLVADIVLCAPVIVGEARAQGKASRDHYAHLTVHGALHALGFDHASATDAARMEAREIEILGTLNIENPYEDAQRTKKRSVRRDPVAAAAVRLH